MQASLPVCAPALRARHPAQRPRPRRPLRPSSRAAHSRTIPLRHTRHTTLLPTVQASRVVSQVSLLTRQLRARHPTQCPRPRRPLHPSGHHTHAQSSHATRNACCSSPPSLPQVSAFRFLVLLTSFLTHNPPLPSSRPVLTHSPLHHDEQVRASSAPPAQCFLPSATASRRARPRGSQQPHAAACALAPHTHSYTHAHTRPSRAFNSQARRTWPPSRLPRRLPRQRWRQVGSAQQQQQQQQRWRARRWRTRCTALLLRVVSDQRPGAAPRHWQGSSSVQQKALTRPHSLVTRPPHTTSHLQAPRTGTRRPTGGRAGFPQQVRAPPRAPACHVAPCWLPAQ